MKVKVIRKSDIGKKPEKIRIETEYIKLDSFLKFCGATQTGGEAKLMIESGEVSVNGETVLQRGRKLRPGDVVDVSKRLYQVSGGSDVH